MTADDWIKIADVILKIAHAFYIYAKIAIVIFFNLDWQIQALSVLFSIAFLKWLQMRMQQEQAKTWRDMALARGATPWEASKRSGYFTAGCGAFFAVMILCILIVWFLGEFGVGVGNIFRGQ